MSALAAVIASVLFFILGVGYGARFERERTSTCIDYWWSDPDGIVESPEWTAESARVNVESQQMYLKEICK